MKSKILLVGFCVISFLAANSIAVVPAFPGAEGSGKWSTGGRGHNVYEVTNLTNDANIGSGSIVDAVREPNRTIIFRVSGTILLGDTILEPNSNTTIAGQTAPGDGICIKGRIVIGRKPGDDDPGFSPSNIIIRYIRVRVDAGRKNASGDAVDIACGNNIIIDHVSASYSRDEGISCQEESDNVTVQWCIISQALNFESHSYGSLIRGTNGQEKTYHHNLYAHNRGRNPRPGNYTAIGSDPEGLHFDFRNNVVYNWQSSTAGYNDDGSGYVSRYNFIGNAYIRGLDSTGNYVFRDKSPDCYGYFTENSLGGNVPSDPWSLINLNMTTAQITAYKARSSLLSMESVTTTSAAQAKTDVLANAGVSFPTRDTVDARMVTDVLNGTGRIINDTNAATPPPGGWWPTLNSTTAPTDTDHDGMPDEWELAVCLNPGDANDRNSDRDSDGFTNLEEYLNWLVPGEPMPANTDTNCDGRVNFIDFANFAKHWSAISGSELYNARFDYNHNNMISSSDLYYIVQDWLLTGQEY